MSDDSDLEAIRQKRMMELQSQYGGGGGAPNEAQQKEAETRRQQMEEQRKHILSQILTPEARERLARVSLVKADKARAVEDMVIRAAQSGQLSDTVDEKKLITLLEQISEKKETKITIQRRRYDDDDD